MTKRIFDMFFSVFALIFLSWIILISWIFAIFDTRSSGIFIQERIGQFGKPFNIYKIRTIKKKGKQNISMIGKFLRKSKIDELPQLINILKGDMSFVGYRPDIAGYYDILQGENRKILELKPGLTCLASIKYANEEDELLKHIDPIKYNDEFIFPDKVKMNLDYYYKNTLILDLKIIFRTLFR